jgi:hypothetical protein
MKRIIFLIPLLFLPGMASLYAQMRMGGSTAPNPSAVLDLNPDEGDNANRGLALPRVKLISTTSASPMAAHVKGMYVYNTELVNDLTEGIYYNNGTKWVRQSGLTESEIISLINNNSVNQIKTLEITLNEVIGTQSKVFFGSTNTVTTGVQVLGIEPVFTGDRLMRLSMLTVGSSVQTNPAGTVVEWSVEIANSNIDPLQTCTLQKVIISYTGEEYLTANSAISTLIIIGQ